VSNVNTGICPCCNGTLREPRQSRYPNMSVDDANRWYSHEYDDATDTMPCKNCGAQYMYGKPVGKVLLNKDGNPCDHEYESATVGRCLTRYTCKHCGDAFHIDSGD
jgi:hypothetical protein